jgi:type I restriction enzyme S subunit
MGNYQGYQKYKDSGVVWLGDIPEHWITQKFIRVAFFQEGPGLRNWQFADNGIRVICVTNITDKGIDFSSYQKFIEQEDYEKNYKHFTVKKKDLLLSSSGNSWGKVAEYDSDEIVILNTSTIRINEHENLCVDRVFLKWILQSFCLREQLGLLMTGACQPNFGPSHLAKTIISIPPLNEQEKIAQFLDYKTKQIDELIKKKETLIEKLDEKRTAIISHAVTKGLDSSVPIKDSGVEWLGDIPEHWEVIKVKHLTKILRGKFTHRPRNDPRFYDGQHPFIQTGDVANANKFIMEYTQTLNENGYAVSKEFPSGTLVMTIAANIGDMAILNFNACFPDSIVGFLPSKMTDIFFLYHLFSSMKKQFLSTAVLNTQLNLNVERISNIFTVIPPLKEQLQITDFLNKEMQKLDLQKAKIKEAIELLKEYRTSLITNAVTGKIDVSQIAVP